MSDVKAELEEMREAQAQLLRLQGHVRSLAYELERVQKERVARSTDSQWQRRYYEIREERDDLRKAINRDQTGLAEGLTKVLNIVGGYSWIPDGEWACYAWDQRSEKTLRSEVANCFDRIRVAANLALTESGKRAHDAINWQDDAKSSGEIEALASAVDSSDGREREWQRRYHEMREKRDDLRRELEAERDRVNRMAEDSRRRDSRARRLDHELDRLSEVVDWARERLSCIADSIEHRLDAIARELEGGK